MRNCNHPLSGYNQQMGFKLSDISSWGQDIIDDLNKEYIDPALEFVGLSPEQAAQIKADAAAAAQKEISDQKNALAQQIIEQATGGSSSGGTTASPAGSIMDTISNIEQNSIVKAIPGGIYTIGGAGLIIVLMLLRGR